MYLIFLFRLTKFVQIRIGMGLVRTRQQGHTIESIRDAMVDLRQIYPNAGNREVVSLLFHEKNMSVSRLYIPLTVILIDV
jgi:hypothetical protein